MAHKLIDLTGQRFGKWTVLEEVERRGNARYWKCKCECGNEKEVYQSSLTCNKTKSCGCYHTDLHIPENMVNRRFGKWTALKEESERNKHGQITWECVCDCGKVSSVTGSALRNGKSMGCVKCTVGNKLKLTGKHFGTWTVISEDGDRTSGGDVTWTCKCDCGYQRSILGTLLKKNPPRCVECATFPDLVGEVFGEWTVIRYSHSGEYPSNRFWECECTCGERKIIFEQSLKRGTSESCGGGTHKWVVLSAGEKYNRWTVIDSNPIIKRRMSFWKCRCECGAERIVSGSALKTGRSNSCGCLLTDIMKQRGGENHPGYNPSITDEERMNNRYQLHGISMHNWRNEVFSNDDFTCACCNQRGYKLNAHHLNAWNAFPEQRFDTANGITLCEDCHKEFHHFYGKGDNTLEQFRDHIACIVGEEHISEIEETLLSRESEIIGQEQEQPTRELQTT